MRPLVLSIVCLAAACENDAAPQITPDKKPEATPPRLEFLWRADGFSAPEGVALAPDGAYFISNVGGEETDGDGYISKLGADGAIAAERFIDALDGPKGMTVNDGFLYVADNVRVRTFDAATGGAGTRGSRRRTSAWRTFSRDRAWRTGRAAG